MKGFCPGCEKECELTHIQEVEYLTIKGKYVPTDADYFVCQECGCDFDNLRADHDQLEQAYKRASEAD